MVCASPRPGESVEAMADRLVGEGVLTDGDRDAVVDFAAFLRDTHDHGDPSTWAPNLLRRHRRLLALTDGELTAIEQQVAAGGRGWPGE
jgi:hypothetical protein